MENTSDSLKIKEYIKLLAFLLIHFVGATQNLDWVKKIDASVAGDAGTKGLSVKTDAQGNVYTIGIFYGTIDFNPESALYNLTANDTIPEAYDIYITKFDSVGNFIWAKNIDVNDYWFYCGCEQSNPYPYNFNDGYYLNYTLSIDNVGNVIIMGIFQGTVDFDPGQNTAELTSQGIYDVFISKLDSDGNFIWAKSVGGPGYDSGTDMTTDDFGNIYVSGYYRGTADFDPSSTELEFTSQNNKDVFVLKLNSEGNLVWAKTVNAYLSGSIAVDQIGNVYYGGACETNADLDPGSGITQLNYSGSFSTYISKLNSNGDFIWAKATQKLNFIKDESNNFFLHANYIDTVDFDLGANVSTLISSTYDSTMSYKVLESVILKYSPTGDFLWAKPIIGIGQFDISKLISDLDGNIYATGNLRGTFDFDPSSSINSLTSGYFASNVVLLKWDNNGVYKTSEILIDAMTNYNIYLLNPSFHVDGNRNIFFTGSLRNTFDFNPGVNISSISGNTNFGSIFIAKYSQCLNAPVSIWLNDNTLTVSVVGDHFQWIDCSDNSEITGETNQTFTPSLSGSYAVTIYSGNCSVTSNCLSTFVGINEGQNQNTFYTYPNPSTEFIHLSRTVKSIFIFNLDGTLILSENNSSGLSIKNLASGTYLIKIKTDSNEFITSKFIKH